MSDLQTRIAATLREHRLGYSVPEGFHCLSVTCNWCDNDLHFADHVAGVLVAELRLTKDRIEDTIWTELERQFESDPFGPCVVRTDGPIDGHVNMGAVAAAMVAELKSAEIES